MGEKGDERSKICTRGKLKENEENGGLNNKKAYEDQFTSFVNSFLELSLFSHTIAHLE